MTLVIKPQRILVRDNEERPLYWIVIGEENKFFIEPINETVSDPSPD